MTPRRFTDEDHRVAPYADALEAHAARSPLMFMVPSHSGTPQGISEDLAAFSGERSIMMDIPQLVDGIDVGSDTPFDRAEVLAADAWGAQRCWFLANGSSQGNRMAIIASASLGEGRSIVAQRSAHSSLLDGLIVSGLTPRFVDPSIDETLGINHGLTPTQLSNEFEAAALEGSTVCAAYVISPSYFGAVSDIRGLSDVAHANGVPLIVDAAWGAHFGFHPRLPQFPTAYGADIVVTSTHKMGGSLSQSAMLHLGMGPFAERLEPLVERAHRLTQTTSASSLLLGSLDIARRSLVAGGDSIGRSMELAAEFSQWLRSHRSLAPASESFGVFEDIVDVDPLRVSIDVTGLGVSGYDVRSRLAQHFGIFVEIATVRAIVAFFGPGKDLDTGRLKTALDAIVASTDPASSMRESDGFMANLRLPGPGERRMSPREAFFAATEIVNFEEAIGRVSSDALAAYPPGIPNVTPGETIRRDIVDFLRSIAASPIGYVRGALDPMVNRFRVVSG